MAKKLEDIFIDGTSFNVEVNAAKTEEEFIEFKKESGVFAKAGDKQTDALKAAYAKIKEQKAINDKIDNPEPEAAPAVAAPVATTPAEKAVKAKAESDKQ